MFYTNSHAALLRLPPPYLSKKKICLHITPHLPALSYPSSLKPTKTHLPTSNPSHPCLLLLPTYPTSQTMTPRPTTTAPAEPHPLPTLTKHELSSNQATYLVRKADMEEFLQETFGPGIDFNVSVRAAGQHTPLPTSIRTEMDNEADAKGHTNQTKSGRWIYYAERKLTTQEVRFVLDFPPFSFIPKSSVDNISASFSTCCRGARSGSD